MEHLLRFRNSYFVLMVALCAAAIYGLSLDATMQGYDDAAYITLAKSIATGQGYRLISSPGASPSTVAPGFPALLAPIWWLRPDFPDGVVLFKLISVLCAVLTIPLLYWFLKCQKELEAIPSGFVVVLVAVSPVTVYYTARLTMSETSYMFISLLALVLMSICIDEQQWGTKGILLVAVIAAASYYVRTPGITVFLAGVIGLSIQRRWRELGLLCLFYLLLIAPWVYRGMTLGQLGLAPATYQSDLLLRDYAHPELGQIDGYWELLPRILSNGWGHVTRSLPQLLLPALTGDNLRALLHLLGMDWLQSLAGCVFALLILVGYFVTLRRLSSTVEWYVLFYIGMILLPSWVAVRNILPIMPFILNYFYIGLQASLSAGVRWKSVIFSASPIRRVYVAAFALMLLSFLASDRHLLSQGSAYRSRGPEGAPRGFIDAAAWLRVNAPPDALLAAQAPSMFYLYTGYHAVALPDSVTPEQTVDTLRSMQVDYVILQPDRARVEYEQPEPAGIRDLVEYPWIEQVFSMGSNPRTFIYKISHDASSLSRR